MCRWETGEAFDLCENHTIVLCKVSLDGAVPLALRAFLACSVRFVVDQLLAMDEVRAKILRPDSAPGLASDAMASGAKTSSHPHPYEGDGDDWDLADGLVDPHVEVRDILYRDFDGIYE